MSGSRTTKPVLNLRTTLLLLLALLLPSLASAQGEGIDAAINAAVEPVANLVVKVVFYSVEVAGAQLPLIVVWLVAAALFFTFYLGFINVRGFKHAINVVRGKYTDPNEPGDVSHFQALATALSGTVGLGNIAGVAVAISLGGPGATFWMIVGGLLGMSSKFAECTLGVKYRITAPDGHVSGGPMYYLSQGLAEKGMTGFGKVLAVVFALCCIAGSFGGGNLFQINQAYSLVVQSMGGEGSFFADRGWLFGLLVAMVVGVVIIGGIKSIARVTSRLVPFMAIIYVATALVILGAHYDQIPAAFALIIKGAFMPEGVVGGAVGVLIMGFRRATFSNEAGLGSAAIAHSAVKTKEPVTEGFVALLEPFIDTVVVCTMTALVLIITGVYATSDGIGGVEMTSSAFSGVFPWFEHILTLAVVLFAFSTMLSWSYYGTKAWTYLFGHHKASDIIYKLMFCCVIVIGCTMELGAVVDFSDSMIFAMGIANILGLYLLAPVVKGELNQYWDRVKQGDVVAKEIT